MRMQHYQALGRMLRLSRGNSGSIVLPMQSYLFRPVWWPERSNQAVCHARRVGQLMSGGYEGGGWLFKVLSANA